jgi:hypothetical protein
MPSTLQATVNRGLQPQAKPQSTERLQVWPARFLEPQPQIEPSIGQICGQSLSQRRVNCSSGYDRVGPHLRRVSPAGSTCPQCSALEYIGSRVVVISLGIRCANDSPDASGFSATEKPIIDSLGRRLPGMKARELARGFPGSVCPAKNVRYHANNEKEHAEKKSAAKDLSGHIVSRIAIQTLLNTFHNAQCCRPRGCVAVLARGRNIPSVDSNH